MFNELSTIKRGSTGFVDGDLRLRKPFSRHCSSLLRLTQAHPSQGFAESELWLE
jgi:hypothetical protein